MNFTMYICTRVAGIINIQFRTWSTTSPMKRKQQFGDNRPLKRAIANSTADKIASRRFVANAMASMANQPPPRAYVPRTPGGQVVAENHYFDAEKASAALLAIATSWAGSELDAQTGGGATEILCLFAPQQGDDISNRTGRKCFVKKIRMHGQINTPAQTGQSTLDVPPRVRLILYCDKQTNGTQSQGEDVINSGSATLAASMFQNTQNFGRFKVYKDKVFTLQTAPSVNDTGTTGGVVQGSYKRDFKFSVNVNTWVNFNATNGGTVADIVDNSFHLIGISDSTTAAAVISYKVRTTFLP